MEITLQQHLDIISAGSRLGYQLCIVIATVIGGGFIRNDTANWPLTHTQRWSILFVALTGALLGCIIPGFFAGGFVEHMAWTTPITPKTVMGGLIGTFLLLATFKFIFRIHFDTSDSFARGAIAMMAIGRIGCILQHCCYGKLAEWGYDFGDDQTRIPVQHIEALALFIIFYVIQFIHTRNLFQGRRLFIVFILYGLLRFMMEFLRQPISAEYFGIGFYQWIALLIFSIGVFQFIKRTRTAHINFNINHKIS